MGEIAASQAPSPIRFIKLTADSAAKIKLASAQISRKHSQGLMLRDTNLKATRVSPPPLPSSALSFPRY